MSFNAFLTTNPSPFVLNLPAIQNVATSASGESVSLLDTATNTLKINTIASVNSSFITIQTNTNFSNASIYMNETQSLTSNSLNGAGSLAIQVDSQEIVRFTGTGLGILTTAPTVPLHVIGDGIVTGTLQVGSIVTLSDPKLKENIQPYTVSKMPEAVSFTWKSTGKRDIGVLATDLQSIEPACVETIDGSLNVNYSKLVVLCLAELTALRKNVSALEKVIQELQEERS
jgi:hypothetical protein